MATNYPWDLPGVNRDNTNYITGVDSTDRLKMLADLKRMGVPLRELEKASQMFDSPLQKTLAGATDWFKNLNPGTPGRLAGQDVLDATKYQPGRVADQPSAATTGVATPPVIPGQVAGVPGVTPTIPAAGAQTGAATGAATGGPTWWDRFVSSAGARGDVARQGIDNATGLPKLSASDSVTATPLTVPDVVTAVGEWRKGNADIGYPNGRPTDIEVPTGGTSLTGTPGALGTPGTSGTGDQGSPSTGLTAFTPGGTPDAATSAANTALLNSGTGYNFGGLGGSSNVPLATSPTANGLDIANTSGADATGNWWQRATGEGGALTREGAFGKEGWYTPALTGLQTGMNLWSGITNINNSNRALDLSEEAYRNNYAMQLKSYNRASDAVSNTAYRG